MKKIVALVLALILAFGCFGVNSFAAEQVGYGDINADKIINSADALLALQSSTGLVSLNDHDSAIADVNADCKVNSSDALIMLQSATGLVKISKSYTSTKKAKVIDSVFSQTAFTFSLNYKMPKEEGVTIKNDAMEMTFTTDGKSKAIVSKMEIDMKDALNEAGIPTLVSTWFPVEYRLLNLNGKNYELMPAMTFMGMTLTEATYEETKEDVSLSFDNYVTLFTADMLYSGTDSSKGIERFVDKDGIVYDFYFDGDTPEKLVLKQDGKSEEFTLVSFKKGATASYLTLDGFKPATQA